MKTLIFGRTLHYWLMYVLIVAVLGVAFNILQDKLLSSQA